jgi:hypothetical protein
VDAPPCAPWSLCLNSQDLVGPIPASLGQLAERAGLTSLDLAANKLEGPVPAPLLALAHLSLQVTRRRRRRRRRRRMVMMNAGAAAAIGLAFVRSAQFSVLLRLTPGMLVPLSLHTHRATRC